MSVGICVFMVLRSTVLLAVCRVCFRKECNAMFIAVDKSFRSGEAKWCN